MPEITVIVPVYNTEDYLTACVESVLAQTFPDFELLLINDGSTDHSGELCDTLAKTDSRIRVFHQPNRGAGGARNTGIENAAGRYLLFLDSDDRILPTLLQKCYEAATQTDSDMVLFDAVAVYPDGSRGARYTVGLPQNCLLQGAQVRSLATCPNVFFRLYRKDLFQKSGIRFPENVWYEDLRTIAKLPPYASRAFYVQAEPQYEYLQRSGSTMHTPDFERIVQQRTVAVNDICTYYDENGFASDYQAELAYLRLFHGFFLPVREMQAYGKGFEPYADRLLNYLNATAPAAEDNPYVAAMNGKERYMLQLFLHRRYGTVRMLSALLKGLKTVLRRH